MVDISNGFSVMNNTGWYITWLCLSWTLFVRLSPSFVCHEQYWLVYQQVLFVVDNNG